MLLLYFSRASYFPAPYVDDHGEKHRQIRGKPLYLDHKRYVKEILRLHLDMLVNMCFAGMR